MKRITVILITLAILFGSATSLAGQEPTIHGYLRHQLATNINNGQIIRNVVTAEVELGYRGAAVDVLINPYFEIAPDTEMEMGLREAYLDFHSSVVDARVGKQIIIWGKSDGLAITDIVSPKDLTNFLIPDFRELRMGVIAARTIIYLGPTEVDLIYVPQFIPSVLPSSNSIWFNALDAPIEPTINPIPEVDKTLEHSEYYARLRLQGSLLDFDLTGGYYWTNEPSPTIIKEFSSPGVLSALTVTPEHYRQWLAGGAISSSIGPLVVRSEVSYLTPKRLLTTDLSDPDGYVEKDYVQSLIGIDTAVAGIDLSAQVMHQFIADYDEALEQDEHSWTATARVRRSFLREQIVLDAFSYIGINAPDALLKVGMTWTPADALSFRAEGNLFFGDSGQFGTYDENDLIVISSRYSY